MRKILSGLMFVLAVCWSAVAFAQVIGDDVVNVGPRGIATQSSMGWGGLPQRGIDGNNDAPASKPPSGVPDKFRIVYRGGVDGDFVCTRVKEVANVIQVSYSSTYSQGHENFFRSTCNNIQDNIPFFVRGGDV